METRIIAVLEISDGKVQLRNNFTMNTLPCPMDKLMGTISIILLNLILNPAATMVNIVSIQVSQMLLTTSPVSIRVQTIKMIVPPGHRTVLN